MGMHKLATTPMPFPIVQSLLILKYLWLLTFPFTFAAKHGWASPPVSVALAYAFFGLYNIGCELEDPLGTETNDLPLETFEGAALQAGKANNLGFPKDVDSNGSQIRGVGLAQTTAAVEL